MNAFLFEFPNERDTLSHDMGYMGSLEECGGILPQLVIAESPLKDFRTDDTDLLSWPFQVLEAFGDISETIILTLPYSYVTGPGRGYLLDLQDAAVDKGYKSYLLKIKHHQFGACVKGTTVFLIITKKEGYAPPKSINLKETTVNSVFPSIITFAPKYLEKVLFAAGSGGLHGFIKATDDALPSVKDWGALPLMCERRKGDTLELGRLTPEELRVIFGVDIQPTDILKIGHLVPNVVYDTFLDTIFP